MQFIRQSDAARALGVSHTRVQQLVKRGDLRAEYAPSRTGKPRILGICADDVANYKPRKSGRPSKPVQQA